MSDLTLCSNKDCAIKWSCLRFWERPTTHRQSYSHFLPHDNGKDPVWCDAHIKMTKADIKRLKIKVD